MGVLKDKTRILVTHAVDFVHLADIIIVMDKGKIVAQGSYYQLEDEPIFKEVIEFKYSSARETPRSSKRAQITPSPDKEISSFLSEVDKKIS